MREWYQPDNRWPALGIRNREDYVQAYVVEGRFHPGVPADVVQAYETVSHLMAQAWYHYPLYDEALAKLLFMQEMAIKLRCKQVGIPATFSSNGKKRRHTLQTFIDALAVVEPAKEIAALLHRGRELRNHFAHPEWHGYAGGVFYHHMLPLLNVLNDLFLDDKFVAQAAAYTENLRQHREELGKGLLVLEWEGSNVLLTDAHPLASQWVQGEWRVIWCFFPMIPRVLEVMSKHQICSPILRVLTALEVGKQRIEGQDVKTGQAIQVKPIPETHSKLLRKPYEAEIRQASEEDYRVFETLQVIEIAKASQELRYLYFWN